MCNIPPEATVLIAAFALDIAIGDPVYPYHPVRLIGCLISCTEKILRAADFSGIFGGILLATGVTSITAATYWILHRVLAGLYPWTAFAYVFDVFAVYSCLALGDLRKHGRAVAAALRSGHLSEARSAVGNLVGRDVNVLDGHGVARACVESLSESFLDGFFAPVFWYAAGTGIATVLHLDRVSCGIIAMLMYKAVNTLDSMVGYRNEQYILFGKASARLDDALNFVPARLSLPVLAIAAILCRQDALGGLRIAFRDRLKHESPNSAHAESFTAGALGLKLGGPTLYPDGAVEKPWLGDGTPSATIKHIRSTSTLILCAGAIAVTLCTALLLHYTNR